MSVFVFFCCPSFSHCLKNGLTFRIYLYWLIKCRKYTHDVSTIMALFQLIASIDCYFIQMPFAGLYFFRVQSHMRETRESCEQICVFFFTWRLTLLNFHANLSSAGDGHTPRISSMFDRTLKKNKLQDFLSHLCPFMPRVHLHRCFVS